MSTVVAGCLSANAKVPFRCAAVPCGHGARCPFADSAASCVDCQAVVAQCLRRVSRWHVPPNWSKPQWMEEAQAQAQAEAVAALTHGDVETEVDVKWPQLASRVLNSVLKRYRQEWSFAGHCGHNLSLDPPAPEGRDLETQAACPLTEAIDQLPTLDQALLELLYWQRRTECQVAVNLGISQQAVSKRKRQILKRLAVILQDWR